MAPDSQVACPHHERIAADVDRHQRWLDDLQQEHDGHIRANGGEGKGHITRREFDKLETCVEDIRRIALRVVIGVLLVSASGSALGPTLKTIILEAIK
ncbi:MAG TPA: hypothetical protein VMW48_06090 [Vicinamibacterales bacterium]|nr:hypothetical protein [Vicinamibacterales bacterium]